MLLFLRPFSIAATLALVVIGLSAAAQPSPPAGSMAQVSGSIVQWGRANANAYAEAMAAAHNPVGPVPVPTAIDPPCTLCGQQISVSNGQQLADAWVQQLLNPEIRYITTLLNVWKQ